MTAYYFIFDLVATLWKTDWKKKLFLSLVLLLTILVVASNIAIPLLLKDCIALLSEQHSAITYWMLFILILYGACWTTSQILMQVREMLVFKLSEECVSILNLRIFNHLHSLDMSFHYERKTGQVMNDISRAQSVFVFILWGALYIVPTLVEIVIAAGIICYFYGLLYSFLLVTTLISYLLFTYFAHKIVVDAEKLAQEKESLAASYMVDSLLNADTIKYFNNRQHEYQQFETLSKERQHALVNENNLRQLILMGQSCIAGIGLTLFTWLSGKAILAHVLQISDFVLINGYFLQFIMPLVSFGFYARSFKKYMGILKELIKLLQIKSRIIDSPHALPFADQKISIEFHHVSFWHEDKPILDSISFAIPAGKTVAIVGATGAGKSTIARLIYRFYDTTAGSIFINGTPITEFQQESLQNAMGVVPQDAILFNNTIYYNIAYGKPNASAQEVEHAAQQAGLHQFITSLPDGYQTMVGERGLKISGGEKQRIAIARVLLKNPLLYIFDEATSSLDTVTEKQIQHNLETVALGATKLIIAHRLSTIIHADEIIVLEKGKIVERGTHHSLLNQKSRYHALWNQNVG